MVAGQNHLAKDRDNRSAAALACDNDFVLPVRYNRSMAESQKFLLPAIDLRDGRVVRLTQGDYNRQTVYSNDALEQALNFESAGASWLHVVDLDGARNGQIEHGTQIERICTQTQLKVEVGGGVRSADSIRQLLAVGVTRVILGTAALSDWNWFETLVGQEEFRYRLVLGLDARAGMLAVSGWQQQTKIGAMDIARRVSDWPLGAIVYTDIATDGTGKGPNLNATRELAEATKIPVVASGGVGRLQDLRNLSELPICGAIVGHALYEGAFTIAQGLEVFEELGDRPTGTGEKIGGGASE